ncbi:hypothetical protein D3C86_1653730 [compost metagenome]
MSMATSAPETKEVAPAFRSSIRLELPSLMAITVVRVRPRVSEAAKVRSPRKSRSFEEPSLSTAERVGLIEPDRRLRLSILSSRPTRLRAIADWVSPGGSATGVDEVATWTVFFTTALTLSIISSLTSTVAPMDGVPLNGAIPPGRALRPAGRRSTPASVS